MTLSDAPLPARWKKQRLKYVATCNDEVLPETTDDFEELQYVEISDVSLVGGIERASKFYFYEAPSRARRRVKSGDVLVSTVRTYLKAIAAVPHAEPNLIASTGFCVVRPQPGVDSSFLGWVAKSEAFVGEVVARSVGVSYPAIKPSELATLDVPLPPLEIQRRIARFLDDKTARIDALIEKKRALLDRIAEKRQALITHAVTKGLDSNAPMKDSGINWLGNIPDQWKVLPLRFVGEVILGLTYSPEDVCDENEGRLVVRASNVQNGRLVHADDVYVASSVPEEIISREGDIIICSRNGSRKLIGKSAVVTAQWVGCTFGAFMTTIRSSKSAWLRWVLSSSLFEFQSGRYMSSTINQLTTATLKSFQVPIPPTAIERRIVEYLDSACAELEELGERITTSIGYLIEYRAALISDAVTGKMEGLQ